MTQLLGIFLVINGSRGQRLLFRYPEKIEMGASSKSEKSLETHEMIAATDKLGPILGFSSEFIANMMSPKAELCDQPFQLLINDILFSSYPSLLPRPSPSSPFVEGDELDEELQKHQQLQEQHSKLVTMTLFNVVFVFFSDHKRTLPDAYKKLVRSLCCAIKHEQIRCGFLSKEARTLIDTLDAYSPAIHDASSEASLVARLLEVSILAKHLKDVYDGICSQGVCNILINDWVSVTACLPPFAGCLSVLEAGADSRLSSAGAIRPYHSLLLLMDSSSLLQLLPPDSSPSLYLFVKNARVEKNFQELSIFCQISLPQIYRFAAHLVYWKFARIVCKLSMENIYVVAPNAGLFFGSELAQRFEKLFPLQLLAGYLGRFSIPKSLHAHMKSLSQFQTTNFTNHVVFMLSHSLLIQYHTYFILNIPHPPILYADSNSSPHFSHLASLPPDSLPDHVIPEKGPLLENLYSYEWEYLKSVQIEQTIKDQFCRLCKYFRGKDHVEEIIFRENITRDFLFKLVRNFSNIILEVLHE
eukprot:Sdes_comp17188_c0_seq1m6361